MRLSTPRILPTDPKEWTVEQKEAFGPLADRDYIPNVFRTTANHPKLAKRWGVFGNHVLVKSTLSAKEREIAILRIGWLCRAEYEWAQHAIIGKESGLSDEEIECIKQGADSDIWSRHEKFILNATDELHADAFITDETWAGLSETYNTEQMMDLIFAIGQYNLVSMFLNSAGVQLDEGLKGF